MVLKRWVARALIGGSSAGLALGCAGSTVPESRSAEPPAATNEAASSRAAACHDRDEAFALSDAGDELVKVDVDRAIASYRRAIALYPKEHRIYWKLSLAYMRHEDWQGVEMAMTRAVELAPSFANYWFRMGHAMTSRGEAGERSAFERAKQPLQRCIELDANFAECHHLLGEAYEQTDDERSALLEYSRAIALNPSRGYFYGPLAALYTSLGLFQQAKVVLNEGARLIPEERINNGALYSVYVMLGMLAHFENDQASQLGAMEKAEEHLNEERPEMAFNLGSTYAAMDPPQKPRARRLLNRFLEQACRGAAARRDFEEQCRIARSFLEQLRAP